MLKQNKVRCIIASIVAILPIFFGLAIWDKLPSSLAIHWGVDSVADGFGSKFFAVFIIPIIMLAIFWLCLIITDRDKSQKNQNKKALGIVFYIFPLISVFVSGIIYCSALGKANSIAGFAPMLIGLLFVIIGNYMPKTTQNRTLGIKISWTLNNEENWDKTHRFGGKVWVVGGIILMFCSFLPFKICISVSAVILLALIVLPFIYSYRIYKDHKAKGIVYEKSPKSKGEKAALRISALVAPIILIGVVVLLFTGGVEVTFGNKDFTVTSTYYEDITLEYSKITKVEFLTDFEKGYRSFGFGSAKLSLGAYSNDEFGNFTMYVYNREETGVKIMSGENILIVNGPDQNKTKEIYLELLKKIK